MSNGLFMSNLALRGFLELFSLVYDNRREIMMAMFGGSMILYNLMLYNRQVFIKYLEVFLAQLEAIRREKSEKKRKTGGILSYFRRGSKEIDLEDLEDVNIEVVRLEEVGGGSEQV